MKARGRRSNKQSSHPRAASVRRSAEVGWPSGCDPGFPDVMDRGPRNRLQSLTRLAEVEASLIVHLALYEHLGSWQGMYVAYDDLGRVYQALGDPQAAQAMFEESKKLMSISATRSPDDR
jgi:hypothetical protein